MPDPDPNLAAADQGQPRPGILAALQPGGPAYQAPEDLRTTPWRDPGSDTPVRGPTLDKPYDRAVIASGQTPTASSGAQTAAVQPPAQTSLPTGASGPSDIGKQIGASVNGPLTPELGRRSGIRLEFIPLINWINRGEANGYNELYNGTHFSDMSDHPANLGWQGDHGPDGRPTTAAGYGQWLKGTWNEAKAQYNATHPDDQVHDFSDVSQNKVQAFWIDKTYREQTGGRDIIKDLQAGKTDLIIPALRGQWPSLDKGGQRDRDGYAFSGGDWGKNLAEESRRNADAELKTIERDKEILLAAMAKEPLGSAKRLQMLEEAHDASRRATELYEKQMKTPPAYQPTDMFAGFGGIVLALAAFAGRKSAQPLTASLNGMAGAIEGMNQGNKDQFDRNFKIWDKQTDYALKLVDIHNQEIRNLLEDERLSDAERQAGLSNLYHLFEMDQAAAAARRGDIQSQWNFLQSTERMHEQAAFHYAEINNWDRARKDQEAAGWTIIDDPSHLDEEGNPTRVRYNVRTNQATTLSGEPYTLGGYQKIPGGKGSAAFGKPASIEVTDENGKKTPYEAHEVAPGKWINAADNQPIDTSHGLKVIKGTMSLQGGRESMMIGRVLTAGADAAIDLKNIAELPKDAKIGWFGPRFTPTGPIDAAKKDLAQAVLTSDVSQAMDVARIGIGRALAAMETGGVYINQELVAQYQKLVPEEGDTGWTVLRKLATVRQNAENSLGVTLDNPRLGDLQKADAQKFVNIMREAVPWTVSEVNKLQFTGGPNDTIRGMAGKLGLPMTALPSWAKRSATGPNNEKIYEDESGKLFHPDHTPVQQ